MRRFAVIISVVCLLAGIGLQPAVYADNRGCVLERVRAILGLADKPAPVKLVSIDSLKETERFEVSRFTSGLSAAETARLHPMVDALDMDINNLHNPYSLSAALKNAGKTNGENEQLSEVLGFYKILVSDDAAAVRLEKINNWVKSPAHAVFAYDAIVRNDLSKFSDVFDHLLKFNPYFADAKKIRGPPGSLLTYSFEKESSSKVITYYYKDPALSDEQWFKLDEDARLKRLIALTGQKKVFLSADKIAPTELKPEYLGGYSQELENDLHQGYGWEVSHKKYEISAKRALQGVRDLSKDVKETHSFHFHVVMELPEKYPQFDKFVDWTKQANDYLYLKGMEEGMHGNELTHLPSARRQNLSDPRGRYLQPWSIDDIDKQSYKFRTMGLRAEMYGPERKGFRRIGLELRDATRDINKLDSYVNRIASSVEQKVWEKTWPSGTHMVLEPDEDVATSLMKGTVPDALAKEFHSIEATVALPLQKFDEAQFFNYVTGTFERPSSGKIKEIAEARAAYIKSLKELVDELTGYREKGEKVDADLIRTVIRMNLSEWAKRARISELYEDI